MPTCDFNSSALAAWMSQAIGPVEGSLEVEKFPGGQSNPTYRVRAGSRDYVLRRKPFGELLPSAHAVDREYRLLAALAPTGFPVPRPVVLCEDPQVIGAIFYLMELVEGRTFWDPQLPGLERAHRRAIYESMVVTLARLHDTDVAAVGLASFAPKGNYFERQVSRWIRQYRSSETERLPYMERLIEWLPGTIPTQTGTAIIHGDYRIDNILFAMRAPAVEAVIDWELATIGDPLADLSYFAMHWLLPTHERGGLEGVDFSELGIPTLDEVIALYCAARGCVLPSNLSWYFAYNLFRLTSILQGIKKRSLFGNASSADAEATVAGIAYVAEIGWRMACLAGAK